MENDFRQLLSRNDDNSCRIIRNPAKANSSEQRDQAPPEERGREAIGLSAIRAIGFGRAAMAKAMARAAIARAARAMAVAMAIAAAVNCAREVK